MSKEKISKNQTRELIGGFFEEISTKPPKEVKKIKRLAMKQNIPLKGKRKLFCKKCLKPYSGEEKIRIKEDKKIVKCKNCDYLARWKLKN